MKSKSPGIVRGFFFGLLQREISSAGHSLPRLPFFHVMRGLAANFRQTAQVCLPAHP
jgi:hypothetical protein